MNIEDAKKFVDKIESMIESEKVRLNISVDAYFIVPKGIKNIEFYKLWDDKGYYADRTDIYSDYEVVGCLRSRFGTFAKLDLKHLENLLDNI